MSFKPLDLKFAHLVTLVQRYVSSKFEKVWGTGQTHRRTDGRTDGWAATLNAAPREGRIKLYSVKLFVDYNDMTRCRI